MTLLEKACAGLALAVYMALSWPEHSAAAEGPLKKVRLAEVVRSFLYVPEYVALARGFAREEGLDVELSVVLGGDRIGASLLSNGSDIALTGPEVPIYILNSESPQKVKVFCAMVGADGFYLGSRKKIDRFEWSMLKGSRFLAFRPGSTPQMDLEYMLKSRGIDLKSLDLITNVGIAARPGAWLSGQMEFGIFQDPEIATALEPAEKFYVITSNGKEIGREEYTTFMATQTYIDAHPDVIQAWTNAIAKALAYVRSQPSSVIAPDIVQFFPLMAVPSAERAIDRYRATGAPIWADTPLVDRAGLAKLQDVMVDAGVLPSDKRVRYEDLVITRFAETAIENMRKAGK
jgi:NitT/TauT family transport system substrate-binding protein